MGIAQYFFEKLMIIAIYTIYRKLHYRLVKAFVEGLGHCNNS